ncbi:hypothetical protein BZG36_05127, partial [Bifiguratus adelaidae]
SFRSKKRRLENGKEEIKDTRPEEGDRDEKPDGAEREDDSEEEIEEEKRKDKRFQAVDTACGGILFIRLRVNVDPNEFVQKLIAHVQGEDAEQRKARQSKLKHCARFLPVPYICAAVSEHINELAQKAISERIDPLIREEDGTVNKDKAQMNSCAVLVECRNNPTLKKEDIVKSVAALIPPECPIDLASPTHVIFASVFKSVAAIGIFQHYYELKKYNLGGLLS